MVRHPFAVTCHSQSHAHLVTLLRRFFNTLVFGLQSALFLTFPNPNYLNVYLYLYSLLSQYGVRRYFTVRGIWLQD
jgi:hypothetical protein